MPQNVLSCFLVVAVSSHLLKRGDTTLSYLLPCFFTFPSLFPVTRIFPAHLTFTMYILISINLTKMLLSKPITKVKDLLFRA